MKPPQSTESTQVYLFFILDFTDLQKAYFPSVMDHLCIISHQLMILFEIAWR